MKDDFFKVEVTMPSAEQTRKLCARFYSDNIFITINDIKARIKILAETGETRYRVLVPEVLKKEVIRVFEENGYRVGTIDHTGDGKICISW